MYNAIMYLGAMFDADEDFVVYVVVVGAWRVV